MLNIIFLCNKVGGGGSNHHFHLPIYLGESVMEKNNKWKLVVLYAKWFIETLWQDKMIKC